MILRSQLMTLKLKKYFNLRWKKSVENRKRFRSFLSFKQTMTMFKGSWLKPKTKLINTGNLIKLFLAFDDFIVIMQIDTRMPKPNNVILQIHTA